MRSLHKLCTPIELIVLDSELGSFHPFGSVRDKRKESERGREAKSEHERALEEKGVRGFGGGQRAR